MSQGMFTGMPMGGALDATSRDPECHLQGAPESHLDGTPESYLDVTPEFTGRGFTCGFQVPPSSGN